MARRLAVGFGCTRIASSMRLVGNWRTWNFLVALLMTCVLPSVLTHCQDARSLTGEPHQGDRKLAGTLRQDRFRGEIHDSRFWFSTARQLSVLGNLSHWRNQEIGRCENFAHLEGREVETLASTTRRLASIVCPNCLLAASSSQWSPPPLAKARITKSGTTELTLRG
jgi:hypothetical protein